jgi:lipid-A-disaccharide synthase
MSEGALLYVVAGEASGDSRGAEMLGALRELLPRLRIVGAGGVKIQALADDPFLEWADEAVVGFWDVLKKYGYFRRQFDRMLEEVERLHPAALVLVDYPGFNTRLARAVRERCPAIPIVFYISPQVWAWNRGRIPKMAKYLDLMLCIFPFEKELYEASGLRAEFVGHPMLDSLPAFRIDQPRSTDLVGLFPGSRDREVRRLFPVMVQAARLLSARFSGLRFEAAAANAALEAWMREYLEANEYDPDFCRVSRGRFHALAQEAAAGMVCSGTATLETAYFGLPMVITYKVAWPTWWLGRLLVKLPYIGMPNVLAGRRIVPEWLQSDATPSRLAETVGNILSDPSLGAAQQSAFSHVIHGLGGPGAGIRAARVVERELRSRRPDLFSEAT